MGIRAAHPTRFTESKRVYLRLLLAGSQKVIFIVTVGNYEREK